MTLRLGGDGAITGCTSLEEPTISISGLTMTTPIEAVSGTAAAPSYTFSGDTDNGLYYAGTNSIGLSTAGTNAILIDSSGKVGIGTTPSTKLHVAETGAFSAITASSDVSTTGLASRFALGNSVGTARFTINMKGGGGEEAYLGSEGNFPIYFQTNGAERMRIDSSGRLLVGQSSARTGFFNATSITPYIQLEKDGPSDDGRFMSIVSNPGASSGYMPALIFGKSRSTSAGGVTGVADGDEIGGISFQGADGTQLVEAAQIRCVVDGTTGADDIPGSLQFLTTADGAAAPTERMRIQSDGNILMGRTNSLSITHTLSLNKDDSVLGINTNNATATSVTLYSQGTPVGSISVTASATSYNTSSDYRLKQNVVDIADGITRVKQLQPKRFNFIADADTTVDGFVAHEAQTVVPEAVTGEKDGEEMQGIDQSKLVPLLTAALQEAIAKIETLETKVAALEAG